MPETPDLVFGTCWNTTMGFLESSSKKPSVGKVAKKYLLRKHSRIEHILEQCSFPFIQLSIKNRCRKKKKKNVPLAPLPVEGRAPGSFANQQDSPAHRSSRVIGGYPLPKHFPYEGMVHPRTYVQLSWFSESWVPLKKLLIQNQLNPWITCFSWFVHGLVAENQKPNEPGLFVPFKV